MAEVMSGIGLRLLSLRAGLDAGGGRARLQRAGQLVMTIDELMDGWQSAWSGRGGRDSVQFAEVCAAGIQYEDPLTDEPLDGIDALTAHDDAERDRLSELILA